MAPNRDSTFLGNFTKTNNNNNNSSNNNNNNGIIQQHQKPPPLSMETLNRTVSDISFHLACVQETLVNNDNSNNLENNKTNKNQHNEVLLPPITEIEDAKCECCGMSEECTPQYVKKIRDKFCGRMVCGLCSEAVKEEMKKNGGKKEEAIHAHVSACSGFNRVGLAFPVLGQAQAMREILRKNRGKSLSPRDQKKPVGIARSSSCIPAITKELTTPKNMIK